MQNKANKFTSFERGIMEDTDFLLGKRKLMDKVALLFNALKEGIDTHAALEAGQLSALAGVNWQSAKISKGENHKGLPYMVLDHPRYFSGADICNYRTVFWWGHFFSYTLLLRGGCWEKLKPFLALEKIKNKGETYIGKGADAFGLAYNSRNFELLDRVDLKESLSERPFFRISRYIPLQSSEEEIVQAGIENFISFAGSFLREQQ